MQHPSSPSLVIATFLFAAGPAFAAPVWQWSIAVQGGREAAGPPRAFLWIPPKCARVRAVVVAQHNMEEQSILENPRFREGLADLNFAEVWCAPPFDHLFRFNQGAGEIFNNLMAELAAESGYDELRFAPIVPMGHSAAASWPYYLAAWDNNRVLAALSISGQWPYFRDPAFAPDIWGNRTIDFVPALESMGEYEAANTWSAEGLKERRAHPHLPLSMLANPAQGHFASSDKKADYLILYIRKAAQYRLPAGAGADNPPHLIPIDPTTRGWLVDKWRLDQPPTAAAAPVDKYTGDPAEAFWFFDEELAKATEAYQAQHRGKKPQLVGIVQDGRLLPQTNTHLQINPRFEPQADGVTSKLTAAFYDTVPPGSPRLPQWTGLPVGSPIGHAATGEISIDPICGPVQKLGPDSFAFSLCRGLAANARQYEIVLAATHPGDDIYKPAVEQAQINVPLRNTRGTPQHLTFPSIPNQSQNATSIRLTAISDAGLPVHFYVLAGPAELQGDTLTITPVPPRARYPIKVAVVAWQYGRAAEPAIQTADPVERTFVITR